VSFKPKHYSKNEKRNVQYATFLNLCRDDTLMVKDIIEFGYQLMRKEKLHHHFLGTSLIKTAQVLTFFYLKLPDEYENSLHLNKRITEQQAEKIIALFERRISEKIPVEYITNEVWYLGNKFYVNENVLVPRSIMNTRFGDFLNEVTWENNEVLDLCTGSGCIGVTLALLNANIKVDLLDISSQALEVAAMNVHNYHLNDRVKCIQSNLFENVQKSYDLIITNPPYVSIAEYKASPEEFKKEPKMALEAGVDGLEIVQKILVQAKHYLNKEGMLIAEIGATAAKQLKRKYPKVPFKWFKYRRPAENASRFDHWVDRVFGQEGIFMCKAKELLSIF
jgi:ribosomal protein L3 glutamine methyltransferase